MPDRTRTAEYGEIKSAIEVMTVKIDGINERLDKLNGAVARHEDQIGTLKTSDAVRSAVTVATERQAATWYDRLKPVLGPVGGAALALIARELATTGKLPGH
jgi:hypothetical protein